MNDEIRRKTNLKYVTQMTEMRVEENVLLLMEICPSTRFPSSEIPPATIKHMTRSEDESRLPLIVPHCPEIDFYTIPLNAALRIFIYRQNW